MIADRKMVATLAALSVLAISLVSLPGGAFHNPAIPLVASIPVDGPSYAAARLTVPTDGADFSIEVQGTTGDDNALASLGVWFLTPDGNPQFAFVFTSIGQTDDVIHVGVPPVGTIVSEKRGGAGGFTGVASTSLGVPAGEYLVLAIATTDASSFSGEVNLYASSGVTFTLSTGDSFLFRETEFDGLNVVVKQQTPLGPTWLKVIDGGVAELEVENRLYGLYQGFSNHGSLDMSLEGPGQSYSGSCSGPGLCVALTFTHNGQPGTWTYGLDNVEQYDPTTCSTLNGGGFCFPPVVWAMGADVRLPP